MNKDIYNPRVANLEQEISKLEKEILDGTYKMETTFHLDLLVEKIDSIWKEYESIYNGIENPISKKQLLENLARETEFLKLLASLVKNLRTGLKHYTQVVGNFIEPSVFMNSWNDVKLVLECNNKLRHYYKGMESLSEKMTDIRNNHAILYNQEFVWFNDNIHKIEKEASDAMNRIEELGNSTDRIVEQKTYQQDNEKIKTVSKEMKKSIKEAIPAITRLYAVADDKMIDYEVDAEDFKEENRKNITIDEEYLNTLSLVERMEYIKLVMQNIINFRGQKRRVKYNGEIVSIPEKHYGKWIKCQTKMKECMRQYEKEIVNPLLEEQNEKKYKEEYANLYSEFQQVNDRLLSLTENAKGYMNTNQVVAVASLNKEPLYVLKTSLNRFNTYFIEYKRLQKELLRFGERNNLKVPSIESIENVEIAEKDLYSQIYILKEENYKRAKSGEDTSTVETKIKELQAKLFQMNQGKKFAVFANLKVLFRSTLPAKDISTFYAGVTEKPERLLKSKEYTDKEKESILKDILEKITRSFSNVKGQTDKKNTLKEKKENSALVKNVLLEQVSKVKRGINLLPRFKEKVFKIGSIREARNEKRLAVAVSSVAVVSAAFVGIQGLSNLQTSKEVINTKNIETNKEDYLMLSNTTTASLLKEMEVSSKTSSMSLENDYLSHAETNKLNALFKEQEDTKKNVVSPKKEPPKEVQAVSHAEIITPKEAKELENKVEDDYVDFGDTFTIKDKEIYQNYLDAANKENVLKASNSVDNVRMVDGITYEYNGAYIFISNTQEDAEAKKAALENNGAKQVNYRGVNENGWEGYFVDENVTFTMEGRGR